MVSPESLCAGSSENPGQASLMLIRESRSNGPDVTGLTGILFYTQVTSSAVSAAETGVCLKTRMLGDN